MCRIVGIADFKRSLGSELEPLVIKMRDSLSHGGPDDAGIYVDKENGVALGHRRLSIIDLTSCGHQPMSNQKKTLWITYNGEIYNFQKLKEELVKVGYEFKSKTDTEVILYGYEEWGIEGLLTRLRGMFAFAIYDCRQGINDFKLILAKDRFGIKPLYYYHDKERGRFIFASEMKAIIKSQLVPNEKNVEAMVRFLQLGSVPVPLTTVKNVYSLPSGHYMTVDKGGASLKQYWNLSNYFNKSSKTVSFDEALSSTRTLLEESVKLHLISDVPLGVFLSGGIDSSSLVALASKYRDKPLTTLSIIFNEPEYNEAQYMRLMAKKYKTDHREVLLQNKDFLNELPKIFSCMDEPTIDGVNTYFISKAAKEAGLTVVLSGVGGDEVFLGYKHFKLAKNLECPIKFINKLPALIRKIPIKLLTQNLSKISYFEDPSPQNSYLAFRGLFTPVQIQDLLGISEADFQSYGEPFQSLNGSIPNSLVDSFDFLDFEHYLQDQILKDTDFMSMAHSIELRVPYLDHFLVEYVVGLQSNLKLHNGVNKSLLVKALGDDLPGEIWNRPKMGFIFPFDRWIKDNCKELMDISLNNDTFNRGFQEKMWNNFKCSKIHWSREWGLVVASKFGTRNLERLAK